MRRIIEDPISLKEDEVIIPLNSYFKRIAEIQNDAIDSIVAPYRAMENEIARQLLLSELEVQNKRIVATGVIVKKSFLDDKNTIANQKLLNIKKSLKELKFNSKTNIFYENNISTELGRLVAITEEAVKQLEDTKKQNEITSFLLDQYKTRENSIVINITYSEESSALICHFDNEHEQYIDFHGSAIIIELLTTIFGGTEIYFDLIDAETLDALNISYSVEQIIRASERINDKVRKDTKNKVNKLFYTYNQKAIKLNPLYFTPGN